MIVVVGGVKGGGGKTTIATNLVVIRSQKKKNVLFVDADEVPLSTSWHNQRHEKKDWEIKQLSGKSLHLDLQKESKNYDDIIVDVGGRNTTSQLSALVVADIYLVPFRPSSLDIWTMDCINDLVKDIKKINPSIKCFFLLNQADSNVKDNEMTIEILSESEELRNSGIVVKRRKAFANAISEGLSVVEMKKPDIKACEEIKNIYDFVYKKCTFSVR